MMFDVLLLVLWLLLVLFVLLALLILLSDCAALNAKQTNQEPINHVSIMSCVEPSSSVSVGFLVQLLSQLPTHLITL
jgi:hypothetical protein